MPSKPTACSPAVSSLLRERRQTLGLSLRAVEKLSAEEGNPIPYSTLARIEQGLFDPGVKRLQQLLRLYHVPLQAAGDLLDLEDMAGALPTEKSPDALYRNGVEAWKQGRTRRAVASFIAFRLQTDAADPASRQKAALSFAIAASSLGKHRLALYLLEDLLLQELPQPLLVPVLLQAGISWHWLGSREAALAFLDRAAGHVRKGDARQTAWIEHERASILADSRSFKSAQAALDKALSAYRRSDDPSGYGRALGVRVRLLLDAGNTKEALREAQAARFHAKRNRLERLATLRRIDEGRALLALGRSKEAAVALDGALAEAIAREDRAARFYAHFYLWEAASHGGETERARIEFDSAAYHVGFLDEVTPETRRMRDLLAKKASRP